MSEIWKRLTGADDILRKAFGEKRINILMLGHHNSGKTTLLYKLSQEKSIQVFFPTIGYNCEEIIERNISIVSWDTTIDFPIKNLRQSMLENARVLIFVVDSTDREYINYAKDDLYRILYDDAFRRVSILLVLANKQDLANAMTNIEITEILDLYSIRGRIWFIQKTCAMRGDGIFEGLKWVSKALTDFGHE